ncbi:PIG-L family deacetylase [Streptacidiphilus sp. PB12-B1b]|uniref:PIG-L deacetylase family protein n=1 Tax=Streptacidiphilus sp. PB12-B1b TaxID=2705012 RepID=UPI0015FC90B0|nr:PIG-L family deacetylase [Streptacidiphilus sp. PB12-B1b]QMU76704.1 PIG-L family deacetylase [Streptacidiphilus sp. PB12-B1b]
MTAGPADAIQAAGTPEAAWTAWPGLAALPQLDLSGLRRVLVVAAHPDDEVLGLGGTLAALAAAGTRLRLVAVTDGEASHPHSSSPVAADLARVRTDETARALAALGADGAEVVRLRLPDTRVGLHEAELVQQLAELAEGFDVCAAPWRGDVHADHEAAGRAAVAAGALTGVPVLQYPVWAWHWARPGDLRVPWRRAARIPLDREARERKRAALDCFASQIRPIGDEPADAAVLPPEELAHFVRDFEVVLR